MEHARLVPVAALSDQRAELLESVARRVPERVACGAVLVAVDGVDGAGKSVFADQLAAVLTTLGRTVIRACVDDFHQPRAARYRRGRDSPVGFWLDSYDYPRLCRDLLDPLRPGGSGRYRLAAHDLISDRALDSPCRQSPPGAVLIVDGIFLHRDELCGYWDFSVFLDVPFAVTAARMAARDGTNADPDHPSMTRYVGGQRLYLQRCAPATRATIVIDNADWERPTIHSR